MPAVLPVTMYGIASASRRRTKGSISSGSCTQEHSTDMAFELLLGPVGVNGSFLRETQSPRGPVERRGLPPTFCWSHGTVARDLFGRRRIHGSSLPHSAGCS